MDQTEKLGTASESDRKYAFEQHFSQFKDMIGKGYAAPENELIVYRTCISCPVTKVDQTPIRLRGKKGDQLPRIYTDEELSELSEDDILKEIGHYALSFNDSPESCEQAAKLQYKKLKLKGKPQSYLDNYVNSRGTFIGKFKVTASEGMITGFNEHGHANILLYEGVDLESIRDKDFESIIDYEDEGTGK